MIKYNPLILTKQVILLTINICFPSVNKLELKIT